MRFAVALDLRRLVDWLPLGARTGPLPRQWPAVVGFDAEHQSVADVAVMRNGEKRPSGLVLPRLHPFPQIFRVLALLGRERQHLVGQRLSVAVDDVAMEVVARVVARPLVADESREPARLIVFLHDRRLPLPQRAGQLAIEHDGGHLAGRQRGDDFVRGLHGRLSPSRDGIVPHLHLRIGKQLRVSECHFVHHAHRVGVVGDNEPIQRA